MRLIDADAYKKYLDENWIVANYNAIDVQPTIDAVEVVRCKDCVHSDIFHKGADNDMPLKCLGIRYGGVMPDWYCEHAERSSDERSD